MVKTIAKKKKYKKAKWLSEEALQIAEKREVKGKRKKERFTHLNAEFQRIARRNKKAFLSDQCKKAKWLSEEALQIAEERELKGKGEKERFIRLNVEFQRIARRNKKAFLSDQCKKIEENNKIRKTRDLTGISCKDGHNKGQKWYGLNRSRRY